MAAAPHILIVGGGYVGLYTAFHLQKKLRRGEARVTVVDPQPNMTYQPFLPEAAAGAIEPRHVVVPLRRVLRHCQVLTARVTAVDHERKVASIEPIEGSPLELDYDLIVMAGGSIARTLPIPGLAEQGIGFRTVGEAIYLRNHVLSRLDLATTTDDAKRREKALSFVFIGGGYAGVEAFAELEDMARSALRYYPDVAPEDMHWMLVEAADRILPEVSKSLAVYTVKEMLGRGMDIRLATRVESMVDGHVVLTDGTKFDAETIVWTAGGRANPLAALAKGLPVDDKGRLVCTAELRIKGVDSAWSAGDIAAVPDLSKKDDPAALCGPSAQHAVRQAKRLSSNIVAVLRGNAPKPYVHAYAGSVASLGLRKGVAEIYGVKLKGWLAWFMHRTYHVSRVPTLNRKVRVIADWTLALFFRREAVSLGEIQHPRSAFESAARQ
ncbi:MAG TPA: NAD(P)/FAD-dependent oxidoreductase [Mycobacteriales bacterium]|jgi:NADH dehydrogenase|nr:NAD(P)/FAD-dependent oxidoreductase [Mycobacteriales bacterium]